MHETLRLTVNADGTSNVYTTTTAWSVGDLRGLTGNRGFHTREFQIAYNRARHHRTRANRFVGSALTRTQKKAEWLECSRTAGDRSARGIRPIRCGRFVPTRGLDGSVTNSATLVGPIRSFEGCPCARYDCEIFFPVQTVTVKTYVLKRREEVQKD